MARHKYIQKVFAVIEFVIIFLIIAFLVATTIPGLLLVRKRSQTSKILTLVRSSNQVRNRIKRAIESLENWFGVIVLPL